MIGRGDKAANAIKSKITTKIPNTKIKERGGQSNTGPSVKLLCSPQSPHYFILSIVQGCFPEMEYTLPSPSIRIICMYVCTFDAFPRPGVRKRRID